MNYPIPDDEAEAWCRQNGVDMSFYERQGETHLMHCVGLSKDDMSVEYEYTPGGNHRQVVVGLAIHHMENMMRAKDHSNS